MEPTEPQTDTDPKLSAERGRNWRRSRDLAWFIPAAGVFLLVSPLLNAVNHAGHIAGIPAIALYIFGIWFALIGGSALLARRLRDDKNND